MSLLQRFMSWARGNEPEQEEGETERSPFECLPVELYGEIFKHLDVQNLKNCKAVCYSWTMGLSASRLLLKKSVSVRNVYYNETSNGPLNCSYFCNRVQIFCEHVRLHGIRFDCLDLILTHFPELYGYKFITYLEISNMTMNSDILAHPVSRMDLLISLAATNIIFHVVPRCKNPKYPNPEWSNLKTLTIQIRHVRIGSDVEISKIGNYCTNLKALNFQAFCSPRGLYNQSFEFNNFFINFLRTIRKNSNTLKTAVLDTFRIDYDRECPKLDGQEQAHEYQDRLFLRFMEALDFVTTEPNWDTSDILVKRLHLGFQLVKTGSEWAQELFLPFLRTLRGLKEFSLSHVHFPGNGRSTIQELQDCLPANCRTKFEGVTTIRTRRPLAPLPPFQFAWEALDDLDRPNFIHSPIHGYFDSTVGLFTASHSLTLRFVFCNSLQSIDFYARNIQFLTKIKVDQSGTVMRHKIILDDGDMQRIIRLAIHLTDLSLECCDLSEITDFGLTGITAQACARMSLTRNFELLDSDRVGIPVSGLKKLRSLKLSTFRNQVTDVTAYHGFKGLNSLAYFGICKPEMTSKGFQEIRRLFEFNQVVQFDPCTKYQFDCINSA